MQSRTISGRTDGEDNAQSLQPKHTPLPDAQKRPETSHTGEVVTNGAAVVGSQSAGRSLYFVLASTGQVPRDLPKEIPRLPTNAYHDASIDQPSCPCYHRAPIRHCCRDAHVDENSEKSTTPRSPDINDLQMTRQPPRGAILEPTRNLTPRSEPSTTPRRAASKFRGQAIGQGGTRKHASDYEPKLPTDQPKSILWHVIIFCFIDLFRELPTRRLDTP